MTGIYRNRSITSVVNYDDAIICLGKPWVGAVVLKKQRMKKWETCGSKIKAK